MTSSSSSAYPRPLPVPPTLGSPVVIPTSPEESSMNGASTPATTARISSSAAAATSGEVIACNGCKLGLEETADSVVVSFGSSLWHVDCRCAKCHNLVEHDTNLLLLSDGSPVCENCSYICSVCQKPISNEAIVTGDESYHAECFRCRSCSNKIEELIFAKTTQGIWCMACHNERVARSRKHAEAKRSRSVRKEKERSSKHRGERERERSGLSSAPLTAASDDFDADLPSAGTMDGSMSAPPRPLPPSPFSAVPGGQTDAPLSSSTSNRRPRTSPTEHDRGRFRTDSASSDVPASNSSRSLSSALGNTSPHMTTPSHSRQPSTQTLSAPEMDKSLSQSSTFSEAQVSGATRVAAGSSRPGTADAARARSSSPSATRPPFRSYDSNPPLQSPKFATEPASPRESINSPSLPGSRQGSLSAPVDKVSNRRSGFYGQMRRPSAEEEALSEAGSAGGTSSAAAPSIALEADEPTSQEVLSSPSLANASTPSFLPELHNSMSFYDPDTLLFLDQVNSTPSSPKIPPLARANGSFSNGSIQEVPNEQLEHLSPLIGAETSSDDDAPAQERRPKSEVARKVRESIRRSREGTEGEGMNMDVELVEMLLSELDGTKKEMKEIQAKYNALRRASRSAFEGFSMAREEYDKEVAARRQAEEKMDELRHRFTAQAMKLAAVDKEQKTAEALKRQSKELRMSVVGMEKHLSQLRAEVELTTAHAAQLGSVETEGKSADHLSTSTSQNELVRALNSRLEKVKDEHRQEIEDLVRERDELSREVAELKQTRDIFAEETSTLNNENSALAEKNADAARKLDSLNASISSLRAPGQKVNGSSRGHQATSSTSSFVTSTPSSRSVGSSSRTVISSPTPIEHDEPTGRALRIGAPEPASVAKKFKWGKGKASTQEAPRSTHAPASSTSKALPTPRSNGTPETTVRIHSFQQTSILRPVRCEYCGDKMWGLNEVRCTGCGTYSHAKCAGYLQTPCSTHQTTPPQEDTLVITGQGMFGNDLSAQVRAEDRQVPIVVTKCIGVVEAYGMNYEGVYRKTGGMGQTKLITQCFERGQEFNLQDVDKFNDLAAITSCLKNFFRALPDPLFTHELHESFVKCSENPDSDARLVTMEQLIYKLPEAHFYTARVLMAHLHRVHLRSNENKMTPANLGVVFGPTVLRSSVASREFSDMGYKVKVVELMVENYPRLFKAAFNSAATVDGNERPSSANGQAP